MKFCRSLFLCCSLLFSLLGAVPRSRAESVSLAGAWRFQLDRENAGIDARWFASDLAGTISLPGSLPGQGIGEDVTVETKWTGSIFDRSYFSADEYARYREPGKVRVPFWLQPEKYFSGAAWFQRDIDIPAAWSGRRVVLTLERPHWETRVWLDDREIGSNNSLSTPHEYDLGAVVASGRHRLSVRVDNSLIVDIGINSHSISDNTQGNWNGIVGRIELSATAPQWIDDLQVYPRVATRSVVVRGRIGAVTSATRVLIKVGARGGPTVEAVARPDGMFDAECNLGANAATWDEFSPALHELTATLANGEAKTVTFGLREIATRGTQLLLNGRPTFFRGTLECAIFPKTGHPPTDVAAWERIIRIAQAHGLNLIRFHSWCPPEAAFVAADKLGFYFQVEAASWPNQSTTLGDGKPVDAWLEAETLRILRAYGNHPSFLLMASTNEPGGKNADPYLAAWVSRRRAADDRRLYTSGAGWPELPENQFHLRSEPRVQHWEEGLASRINARAPETRTDYRDFTNARSVPVISHEIGQWCVYPNFDEMPKYTGYLKPRNFEIFRDSLAEHHMGAQAHDFLIASGKLQALCYKEDIEAALRTPSMGGFELLDLHDFPGQGTALVGVLDPFWDEKGYITAKEFRRFCNSTVPLARFAKRVFTSDEPLEVEIEIAHFGAAPLAGAVAAWKLVSDDGAVVTSGRLPPHDVAIGNGISLGRVAIDLRALRAPARYKLIVAIEGTSFENDWDVWVYPPAAAVVVSTPANVTLAREFDDAALARLEAGGSVLLMIPPARVRDDPKSGKVALGFSSIFWNTAWTNGQAPHTLGILCDPKHAALARFPTESHSNWQWWYPISQAGALIIDDLPPDLRPIVQVIDTWFSNRRLALVFEARVGKGKLLVCAIDLTRDDNPVSRQLLASLLAYSASRDFAPTTLVSAEQVRALMTPPR